MIRLVAKANGFFDDGAALARVPTLVRRGTTYPVRILAQGDRIQVFLNGEQIINVTDTTYTNGRIGLNVFGGGRRTRSASRRRSSDLWWEQRQ